MLKPRDHLRSLAPYELPGSSTDAGNTLLQLAQNENYTGASPRARDAAKDGCDRCAFYPDPDAAGLRSAVAGIHGLAPERVVCGRGAMELISLLAAVYLEPGASAVVSEFGYLYFGSAVELAGARVITAPEPDMILDPDAIAGCIEQSTRMVFLANPGNPTGSYVPGSELVRLRALLPASIILVIDEAYAEFVEPERYRACFELVEEGATVVLRTFSKIYGLAGLRVGWGYFPAGIASLLRVVQQPNAVTGPGQAAATAAALDQRHVEASRALNIAVRNEFSQNLRTLGLDPAPSQGNFVLVRFRSRAAAAGAHAHLRADDILVREMNGYGLSHCLRVTLGTRAQMQQVARSLEVWSSKQ